MKLIGYINPFKNNSFTIPIYNDGIQNYFHELDQMFMICGFSQAPINNTSFKLLPNTDEYAIGGIAPIVFCIDGEIIYGPPSKTIKFCLKYLDSLHYPLMHIYEETYKLGNKLKLDLEYFQHRFQLKILVQNTHPDSYSQILEVILFVNNYLDTYKKRLKRKSSFKDFLKDSRKKIQLRKHKRFNRNKIENFKEYVKEYVSLKEYNKGYNELAELLKYQCEVSSPKFIVKSLTDLSNTISETSILFSKTLIFIAYLFEVQDVILDTQYGELLKAEGDFKESKRIFRKILKHFPNDTIAKNGYGDLLKLQGNYNEAQLIYTQLLEKDHTDIFALSGLAEVYKCKGNYSEAKSIYLRAQDFHPNDPVIKSAFAGVLKSEGKLIEAKNIYIELQKQFPEDLIRRHSLLNLCLLTYDFDLFDKYNIIINNPKTVQDFYYAHTNIMYDIRKQNFKNAESNLLKCLETISYYDQRDTFKRTLTYLRILNSNFAELKKEIELDLKPQLFSPVDDIFRTHIYSEVNDFKTAKIYFRKIKSFPEESDIFESASLLSELFSLNGLKKQGLSTSELRQNLYASEYKNLLAYKSEKISLLPA